MPESCATPPSGGVVLVPLELWCTFFDERSNTFACVFGFPANILRVGLVFQGGTQITVLIVIQRALGQANSNWRACGHLLRQGSHRWYELFRGHDLADDTQREGVLSINNIPGKNQFACLGHADEAR